MFFLDVHDDRICYGFERNVGRTQRSGKIIFRTNISLVNHFNLNKFKYFILTLGDGLATKPF